MKTELNWQKGVAYLWGLTSIVIKDLTEKDVKEIIRNISLPMSTLQKGALCITDYRV